jgi:excisionase family DNA binding protein
LTKTGYYINILNIFILIEDELMLSTVEAAKRIGVSKSTLLRWLDEGLIDDVERDWRGWRIWRSHDIERIKAFQKAYHSNPIKRVRRSSLSRAECAKAAAQSMVRFAKGYVPRPEVGM